MTEALAVGPGHPRARNARRRTRRLAGGLQLDLSSCSRAMYSVAWKLVDATSGATVASCTSCSSTTLANLAAGSYRLSVARSGRIGTYSVNLGTG